MAVITVAHTSVVALAIESVLWKQWGLCADREIIGMWAQVLEEKL
jgi:hypothetical protein